MRRPLLLRAFLIVLMMVFASTTESRGGVKTKHTENFSTTTYRDALNTAARWDTVAGELKLPMLTLAGSVDTPGEAWGIFVEGNHAYVADLLAGLQVIDISNPTAVVIAGSYDTPALARDVFVAGNCAYVADGSSGLQVIDITDPTTPAPTGSYNTPGHAYDVYVAGDYAYVADGDSGMVVIDVTDPANPVLAGGYDTPGLAFDVLVEGNYAYVADLESGLQVIDITDPTSPASAGSYETPNQARGVAIAGNYAYVADSGSGLHVINITDPTNPVLGGSYNTPGSAYGVAVDGDFAYVADGGDGLHAFDISNPANPLHVETYNTPGESREVALAGKFTYVADRTSGVQVVQIAELAPPALAGAYDTPGEPYGVYVSGDHALVTDGFSGLHVIDISNPAAPTLLGSYITPGYARAVYVSGDHAFVTDSSPGLHVIDISNPAAPTLLGSYITPGDAYGVCVSGDHALMADFIRGLQVIDISNPAAPTLVGSYDSPSFAIDVYVSGDYAFVTDDPGGLQVIDISDPATPTLAGTYFTPYEARGVYVSGDYAFVADGISGLQVIDISNPAAPTLAGSYDSPGLAYGVAVDGDYAFVADLSTGLLVIDIGNPDNPTLAASYEDVSSEMQGVRVSGDHAIVMDRYSGLQVIEVFSRDFYHGVSTARSLALDQLNDTIPRARLNATHTDSIRWELSSNGGMNWEHVVPGSGWHDFASAGSDIQFRSTHVYRVSHPTVNPTCSGLEIEWRYEFPAIQTVEDAPSDQGGYVALNWKSSGYDFFDLRTVTHYSVWRAVDLIQISASGSQSLQVGPEDIKKDIQGPAYRIERTPQGEYYWEWVDNVTALYFEGYSYAVPTRYDSIGGDPAMHYFQVVAHTSDQWTFWVSPPDSGYSVDNLAPSMPLALAGEQVISPEGLTLRWLANTEPDLGGYAVYRGASEDFEPGPDNLIAVPSDTMLFDSEWRWDSGYYYKVSAIDIHENESSFAHLSSTDVTGIDSPDIPRAKYLSQNHPNPFNPSTTIAFGLDEPADMTLVIYDVAGRVVRTLVEGPQPVGEKRVTWNGIDDRGGRVATGVYFYRMTAPGFEMTKKMVLLQ
jgi:hypothetical protein